MPSLIRSFRRGLTIARNQFSPTLGVNREEPVTAWALRRADWLRPGAVRANAIAIVPTGVLTGLVLSGVAAANRRGSAEFVAVVALVVARLVLDYLIVARSATRLGPEFESGRWDQIRMTAQTEGAMLRAHFTAAYAGGWRLMTLVLGLQIGVVAGLILTVPLGYAGLWTIVRYLPFGLTLGALFTVELLLRVRTVNAIGLAFSASLRRGGMAVVASVLALVMVWIVQFAALLIGLLAVSFAMVPFQYPIPWWADVAVLFFAFAPVILVIFFVERVALYRLARAVAERSLNN